METTLMVTTTAPIVPTTINPQPTLVLVVPGVVTAGHAVVAIIGEGIVPIVSQVIRTTQRLRIAKAVVQLVFLDFEDGGEQTVQKLFLI